MDTSATIVAPATPPGGAIAVVRVSGPEAIAMCDTIFCGPGSPGGTGEADGFGETGGPGRVGRVLSGAKGYTLHYGAIVDPVDGRVVDEVLVSLFRAPRSYTGEDMVEISCHGSPYIRSEIIRLLVERGARPAEAGEFTVRAFLAGKIDLSQAEAVADTIAAEDRAAHALALSQMRGGYSSHFAALRGQLIALTSLLELELDFSQEDVRFADRDQLLHTASQIAGHVDDLLASFALGNAIKEGIGVAIVGRANVGKSTLLNRLVREERAMVSEIAGTTRDAIEERLVVGGATFRLTDTAGIRDTDDRLELMGIERTFASLSKAAIVLLICTPEDVLTLASPDPSVAAAAAQASTVTTPAPTIPGSATAQTATAPTSTAHGSSAPPDSCPASGTSTSPGTSTFHSGQTAHATPAATVTTPLPAPLSQTILALGLRADQRLCVVVNKVDTLPHPGETTAASDPSVPSPMRKASAPSPTPAAGIDAAELSRKLDCEVIALSARTGEGVDELLKFLERQVDMGAVSRGDAVVSSSRHYEALQRAAAALKRVRNGLAAALPADLLAQDLREALHHIGTVTGQITTDDILGEIFSKFCVGK